MSEGTGWSWSHFPRRHRKTSKFQGLSREQRAMLRELYDAADKWGKGPGDPMPLKLALGLIDAVDDWPRIVELHAKGLVWAYEVDGSRYWKIREWDEDAPYDLIRKRKGRSDYPDPPPEMQSEPGVRTAPSGRTPGADKADGRRTVGGKQADTRRPPGARDETRRDETRDPTLRSDLLAPCPGAPEGEPRPAASTTAHARAQATNAAPASAPVPPALGGAGTAQGDPGGEPQPVADPGPNAAPHDPVPVEPPPVELGPGWGAVRASPERAPPPRRGDFGSVADFEQARQSWLAGAS